MVVAVAVALLLSLVFLTTSTLMSDCVFLAVQLATLFALERWTTRTGTVVAGVGAAVAMLMRSVDRPCRRARSCVVSTGRVNGGARRC